MPSGGGRQMDPSIRRMVQHLDQDKSNIALSFKKAQEVEQPVVIIAGMCLFNQFNLSLLPMLTLQFRSGQ
jgi:hypothetical protein